jgi:hypothetical protein
MKKQRMKIGALFAIDLGNGKFAFGRDVACEYEINTNSVLR